MQGLHLTADLSGCPSDQAALTDSAALRRLCTEAATNAGLTVVGACFHPFPPEHGEARGVTGVLLLAESHLAVHTWPELDAVTLDIYVCHRHADNSARAEAVLAALLAAFAPASVTRHALRRGEPESASRAERRAAPKPARAIPSGDSTTYPSGEGSS